MYTGAHIYMQVIKQTTTHIICSGSFNYKGIQWSENYESLYLRHYVKKGLIIQD